jgi:hypothetical protein
MACAIQIQLAEIPPSLMRKDLIRRLPAPINGRFSDITGKRFGDSSVIGFAGFYKQYPAWLCRCECGTYFVSRQNALANQHANSCGCHRISSVTKHGLSTSVEFQTWKGMRQRCYDPNCTAYHRYGGRGIRVCDGWNNSVEKFVADMGQRPSGDYSIDRKDNDGHYSCGKCQECKRNKWPANCRWATRHEQLSNKSGAVLRPYTLNGVTKPMTCWSEGLGISRERMRQRVNKCIANGIDVSEALTTPAGETMPSLRNQYERYRLRIVERNAQMVKEEWFDGKVHVIRQGEDWSGNINCHTFAKIVQAEAMARGGKCKFRILEDHAMFVYEKKKTAAA